MAWVRKDGDRSTALIAATLSTPIPTVRALPITLFLRMRKEAGRIMRAG